MRVDLFRCDGCGRESKDTNTWVRVVATSFDSAFAKIIVKQPLHHAPVAEKSSVDLCSRECAGRWLFGAVAQ